MRSFRLGGVRRTRRPLLALTLLIALLTAGYVARALDSGSNGGGTPSAPASVSASAPAPSSSGVALSSLPPQVADTVRLIRSGGPFPYPSHDGVTFHNFEHTLPTRPDGYYREYTVPTPGSPDRGPRRVITGRSGEFFYTADHYRSFQRVDLRR